MGFAARAPLMGFVPLSCPKEGADNESRLCMACAMGIMYCFSTEASHPILGYLRGPNLHAECGTVPRDRMI